MLEVFQDAYGLLTGNIIFVGYEVNYWSDFVLSVTQMTVVRNCVKILVLTASIPSVTFIARNGPRRLASQFY